MSSACHMFFGGSSRPPFRARVISIVITRLVLNQNTLPFSADCSIAGVPWQLSTNSPYVLQAAEKWRPLKRGSKPALFEMEVLVDSAQHAPLRTAHFRGIRHLVFATLPPSNFVVYDLARKRVHAALSEDTARNLSFWNNLLLPISIGVLGTAIGIAPLHCACLERNGAGFLLAGVSGAGKSTLTMALANRGFAFISDDWTYVSKARSAPVAHGLYSPIKLLPDAVRFFPYLRTLAPHATLNGELAYELDPLRLPKITAKSRSYPQRLLFLERLSAPGCHFKICPPEYAKAYFEAHAERLPDEVPGAKEFRSDMFQHLAAYPAWILRTGEGPHETAEALDDFLSEATHAVV